MNQKLGTPYYIAPEVQEKRYDEKCDFWSSGVILYILLCGLPPFNRETNEEILENVKEAELSFDGEQLNQISYEAKLLIKKKLEKDPRKRINAEQAQRDPGYLLMLKRLKLI